MAEARSSHRTFKLGPFEVDLDAGELHRGADRVQLQEQPFRLLALLVSSPGALVTREEVRAKLWPKGTYVDFDRSLNTAVKKLRRALGDSARRPHYVETVARRGYRLRVEAPGVASRAADAPTGACTLAVRVSPGTGRPGGARWQALREVIAATGGEERGGRFEALLAAFHAPADALRCAIALQQASAQQQPGAAGGQLRVGIDAGVDVKARTSALGLARRASIGEILCAEAVRAPLEGREAFQFRAAARAARTGADREATLVHSVVYDPTRPTVLLARPPFVGREHEIAELGRLIASAQSGRGGLVLVSGEAGIGKTRVLEELAERARRGGARVLYGRCPQGDFAPPFAAFAEALDRYARFATPRELARDLGLSAGVLARLVPAVREQLADLREPAALRPNEESHRLIDAIAQLVQAVARRETIMILLDDLHWASAATLALLGHLARLAPSTRLMLAVAYRAEEVGEEHPLAAALPVLRREEGTAELRLAGLADVDIRRLLETVSTQEVAPEFAEALQRETNGHPFFLRELLLHWLEDGRIHREDGRWTTDLEVDALGVPESVRALIDRRLSTVSDEARRLLTAAAGCPAAFRFEVVYRAADLAERRALDALDEVVEAQLVRPEHEPDTYAFTHALFRHVLYTSMTTARQVRLHRRLAEEMERAFGELAAERAGEVADQYYRSAALAGAERGVVHCLAAADHAERAPAQADAAAFLRMGLRLVPPDDPRRTRMLARLGRALAWSGAAEEATRLALGAVPLLAAQEGAAAAAEYAAEAADAIWWAAFDTRAWRVAAEGLRHTGGRRDLTWARLLAHDLNRREGTDPVHPGIPLDSPERRELSHVVLANPDALELHHQNELWRYAIFSSRSAVLERAVEVPHFAGFWAGDYRRALARTRDWAEAAHERGQIARGAMMWSLVARLESALGNLAASHESYARATALAARVPPAPLVALWLGAVPAEHAVLRGAGLPELIPSYEGLLRLAAPENQWAMALTRAGVALAYAEADRTDDAMRAVAAVMPAIERAPGWSVNYTLVIHLAIAAAWTAGRADFAEPMELHLREKTLAPDFRYPHADARLSLARLCALQGRHDEAAEWFLWAREVLDEQGARPLRALADYDEARMWLRRGAPGDAARAKPFLAAARRQFATIGMPGWARRAAALAS